MTTRRQFVVLALGALATGAGAQLTPDSATARRAALEEAVRKAAGGAQVRPGRVKLAMPSLIENGNSVPLTVTAVSPMTAADHVRAIHVFTERNPQPYVISAWLGPRAGRASVTTRARIADSGTVIALAQMSDGTFWSDSIEVVVTLSACLEDGPN